MIRVVVASMAVFTVAVLSTMAGRGGGNVYVPALVAAGQSMHQAATTGQLVLLLTACAGMLVFQKHRLVDWKLALVIDPATDVMALVGNLNQLFAWTTLAAAVFMMVNAGLSE
jgi:uncharacterized membrane protein YfcA